MKGSPGKIPQKVTQGLYLFNQGYFYEAHEYFEDAWRETEDDSREFYRVLLQLSGGFFRLNQRRPQAAKKFFSHALGWLERFPNPTLDFDTLALKNWLKELIAAINRDEKSEIILQNHFHSLHPEN